MEPAQRKGVAPSYMTHVLRLTLLAPEIVEAILDGRQQAELQLDDLLKGFPLKWEGPCSSDFGVGSCALSVGAGRLGGRERYRGGSWPSKTRA